MQRRRWFGLVPVLPVAAVQVIRMAAQSDNLLSAGRLVLSRQLTITAGGLNLNTVGSTVTSVGTITRSTTPR